MEREEEKKGEEGREREEEGRMAKRGKMRLNGLRSVDASMGFAGSTNFSATCMGMAIIRTVNPILVGRECGL